MESPGKLARAMVPIAVGVLLLVVGNLSLNVSAARSSQSTGDALDLTQRDVITDNPTIGIHNLEARAILVDDFEPQPRPGEQPWLHNRLGGDRGRIDGPGSGSVEWGKGVVTATITGGTNTHIGVWTALNHPIRDCTPLNFSSIFPPQIKPLYQARMTGLQIHALDGQGTLQVQLQIGEPTSCPPQTPVWTGENVTLSGGQQDISGFGPDS
jgi:hypothetical protein